MRVTIGKYGYVPLRWFNARFMGARREVARFLISTAARLYFHSNTYFGDRERGEHALVNEMRNEFDRLVSRPFPKRKETQS